MEIPCDPQFLDEEARFRLKWHCEDCGLFDNRLGCTHGYPTERHRRDTHDPGMVLFCKDFEVG